MNISKIQGEFRINSKTDVSFLELIKSAGNIESKYTNEHVLLISFFLVFRKTIMTLSTKVQFFLKTSFRI